MKICRSFISSQSLASMALYVSLPIPQGGTIYLALQPNKDIQFAKLIIYDQH